MTSAERTKSFAPDLSSVRAGRHFVRDTLLDWGLEELVDDAQLCVSEIVTNAVLHAGTRLDVAVHHDKGSDTVLVEVTDRAPGTPRAATAVDETATSGRGLQIVEAVAREWGVRPGQDGKTIWVRLEVPDAVSPGDDENVLSMKAHRESHSSAADAGSDQAQSG